VPSRLADILFSASLLAHAAATAASAAALPMTLPLVINGRETALDPASGRLARTCRATLITSIENLASINLSAVDPPSCLRSFAGTVNEAGNVSPIAASSGTTASGRQIDLATIDPYEFEGLITELAQAMGYTAATAHPEATTTESTSTSNPATRSPADASSSRPSATTTPSDPTTSAPSTAS
jgi:hypothetical protein